MSASRASERVLEKEDESPTFDSRLPRVRMKSLQALIAEFDLAKFFFLACTSVTRTLNTAALLFAWDRIRLDQIRANVFLVIVDADFALVACGRCHR